MGLDEQAARFLAEWDRGHDVPGGVAFAKALQQARLDGSLESLDRIDALLAQMRAKLRLTPAQLQAQPGGENFLLLLAFYVGSLVARWGQTTVRWATRAEAQAALPAAALPDDASWARIVGLMPDAACVPLGVLEDSLFGDAPQMTCRQYVERLTQRALRQPDENARCRLFLDAFRSGQELPGGLAFEQALRAIQLDDSAASLERLDALLRRIRAETQPQYEPFVNGPATQNFLRFAAFYTASTVARVGNFSLKWLNHQELAAAIEDLEFRFESTSGCVIDGRVFFPLALVTEILLQPAPERSVHGWAAGILANARAPLPSIRRIVATDDSPMELNGIWEAGARDAGFAANLSMFMVEGGSTLTPRVLVPKGPGQRQIVDFGFHGSGAEALEAADRQMATNPEGAAYQVFAFDGYANLPGGRTDAITIELRCYGAGALSGRNPLALKIVCPYRHAQQPGGFAIFSPKLLECSAPQELWPALMRSFYQGIYTFKTDAATSRYSWNGYLDESV